MSRTTCTIRQLLENSFSLDGDILNTIICPSPFIRNMISANTIRRDLTVRYRAMKSGMKIPKPITVPDYKSVINSECNRLKLGEK